MQKKVTVADWLSLLRVNQYTKNFFVLAPVFFSFKFTDLHLLYISLVGFSIFSLVASCIYIINDITDIEEDRKHPEKSARVLASGRISIRAAIIMAVILFITAFSFSVFFNNAFTIILAVYFVLNVLYSFLLKHFPITDILIISLGFVLRIYAGGVLIHVMPSVWLTLMTFLISLILALGKRRDDVVLKDDGKVMRASIDGYNLEMLNYSIVTVSAVVIVCYIQYTLSPEIQQHFHNSYLYCNIIFVIAGFLRYFQRLFAQGGTANPSKIILTDRFLQINIVLWLCSFIVFI